MENNGKKPSIPGLNDSGGLVLSAEFNKVTDALLTLHAKSQLGIAMTLCEMGCAEHIDDITYDNVRAMLGLTIFAHGIEEGLSVTEGQISDEKREDNYPVAKNIAHGVRNRLRFFRDQINKQPGFSKNAKDRLVNGLKAFLGETFAKNIPGYTHGIDYIIKDA